MKLALFDLDHTLLPIDSDHTWGVFTTELGWNDPQVFSQRNDEFYAHYQAGTLDIHDYVRFATEAFRLKGPQAAHAAHAKFMAEVIRPAIRPEALALIERHRAAGDHLLVVTATNEFVTRPIVQALGIAGQCIHAAANDQWQSFDAVADDFEEAVAEVMNGTGAVTVTPASMRQAVAQCEIEHSGDWCETCPTVDACRIRGACSPFLGKPRAP